MIHTPLLLAKQFLIEARYSKLLWLFAIILLAGLGLCEYISSVALIEAQQFQLAIFSQLIRWSAVLLLSQFVVTALSREFNEKGLDLLLSMPLSRGHYVCGKLLGVMVLSILMVVLVAAVMSIYQLNIGTGIWLISLLLELWLVAYFAVFVSISVQHPALSAAIVIGFYVLCRALASIELLASQPLVSHQGIAQQFLAFFTEVLSYLLPTLYNFAKTQWLIELDAGSLSALFKNVIQSMIYCALIGCAAIFDLYRKPI